jgi:enoyl-CoA hydratase/carnithine racemase
MPEVVVERSDKVERIQLNRPDKKNAVDRAMYTELADALDRARSDDGVHVALVHAAGDAFTAGNDLVEFTQHPSELEPQKRFIDALIAFDKPLVGAVHGFAVGIGVTMLTHFDFVYAGESAWLQTPFVDLGLVPEAGSSYLLPAEVGYHAAAELLMLGERMPAPRAAEIGLITRAVPDADVMNIATATARLLAAKPLAALRACKRLLRARAVARVPNVSNEESKEFAARLMSPETKEALSSFFQKRRGAAPRKLSS